MASVGILVHTYFEQKTNPDRITCVINGNKFSFLFKGINQTTPVCINLMDHNLVILSPIKSSSKVQIRANSAIVLAQISTPMQKLKMEFCNKLISLGDNWEFPNRVYAKVGFIKTDANPEIIDKVRNIFLEGVVNKDEGKIFDGLQLIFDCFEQKYSLKALNTPSLLDIFRFFGINDIPDLNKLFKAKKPPKVHSYDPD